MTATLTREKVSRSPSLLRFLVTMNMLDTCFASQKMTRSSAYVRFDSSRVREIANRWIHRSQFDLTAREPLSLPAYTVNAKDGSIQCKKHSSSNCTTCCESFRCIPRNIIQEG